MEWSNIKNIIKSIYDDLNSCTRDNWIKAYSYIYNLFNKSFKTVIENKQSNNELEKFYYQMTELLDEIVNKSKNKLNSNICVKNLILEWDKLYLASKIINNIYEYFNKSYIRKLDSYNQDRFEYLDYFIIKWKELIIDSYWDSLLSEILVTIDNSNQTFVYGITNIISQLDIIDINNSSIYEKYFEQPLIEHLSSKFNKTSNDKIYNENIPDYLDKVLVIINKETKITQNNYIRSNEKITKILDTEFLLNNLDFITKDFSKLVSNLDILTNFYNRIKNYDSINSFKNKFLEYAKTYLDTNIKDIQNDSLIETFVTIDLKFKKYYDIFNNIEFDYKKDFKRIINTKDISNIFVRYIHSNINDTIDDNLIDKLYLLEFIDNKELFIKIYQKFLTKRLLKNGVREEHKIISKLNYYLGYEYSSIISKMITDINTSDELNKLVKYNGKFNTIVLTSNVWPIKCTSNNIIVHDNISKNLEIFKTFYDNKFNGRKLLWCYNLFNGCIETNCFDKKYYLNCNLYQANIILLFNDIDSISLDELKHKLSLDIDKVNQILHNFIRSKLVTIENNIVTLNKKFKYKKNRINLNTKCKKEETEEVNEIVKKVDLDCQLIIESNIVRIMKSRKRLEHTLLISECLKNVSHKFNPKISNIKHSISRLIEQEYLSRCKEDKSIYLYIP